MYTTATVATLSATDGQIVIASNEINRRNADSEKIIIILVSLIFFSFCCVWALLIGCAKLQRKRFKEYTLDIMSSSTETSSDEELELGSSLRKDGDEYEIGYMI